MNLPLLPDFKVNISVLDSRSVAISIFLLIQDNLFLEYYQEYNDNLLREEKLEKEINDVLREFDKEVKRKEEELKNNEVDEEGWVTVSKKSVLLYLIPSYLIYGFEYGNDNLNFLISFFQGSKSWFRSKTKRQR